jgi:hypothetical protein
MGKFYSLFSSPVNEKAGDERTESERGEELLAKEGKENPDNRSDLTDPEDEHPADQEGLRG